MSGEVTIATVYCIVSNSFYRLLFSKKAVFEAFIISSVGSEVGSFLSALSYDVERRGKESLVLGNTECFGLWRPIWSVKQKAQDVSSARTGSVERRQMQPHRNPAPGPWGRGCQDKESMQGKVRQAPCKRQKGNVSVKISFFTPTPKLTGKQFFIVPQKSDHGSLKTLPWLSFLLRLQYTICPLHTLLRLSPSFARLQPRFSLLF